MADTNPFMNIDETGLRYYFGYYDKSNGWIFSSQFFRIIGGKTGYVMGQFLSSTWFSSLSKIGEIQHYLVIGVKGEYDKKNIERIINDSIPPQTLYHKITDTELEAGIYFKDHFVLDSKTSKTIAMKDLEQYKFRNISLTVKLSGECGLSTLELCVRLVGNTGQDKKEKRLTLSNDKLNIESNDKLYITLPVFKLDFK